MLEIVRLTAVFESEGHLCIRGEFETDLNDVGLAYVLRVMGDPKAGGALSAQENLHKLALCPRVVDGNLHIQAASVFDFVLELPEALGRQDVHGIVSVGFYYRVPREEWCPVEMGLEECAAIAPCVRGVSFGSVSLRVSMLARYARLAAVRDAWMPEFMAYSDERAAFAKENFTISRVRYIADALYVFPDDKLKEFQNIVAQQVVAHRSGLSAGYVYACMQDVKRRFGIGWVEFAREELIECATEPELAKAVDEIKAERLAVAQRISEETGKKVEDVLADMQAKRNKGISTAEYLRGRVDCLPKETFQAYIARRTEGRREAIAKIAEEQGIPEREARALYFENLWFAER